MPEQQEDEVTRNLDVRGSLSTKVESVVKTLLKIQRLDPTAKSLVFSTWNGILDIIGEALDENEIHHASLATTGGKNFKRNLQKFKVHTVGSNVVPMSLQGQNCFVFQNRDDVKVLLMPLKSGANGLNLIEANHVLLVEPILNPAEELQAIGRVHRIGQKKATIVHRYEV